MSHGWRFAVLLVASVALAVNFGHWTDQTALADDQPQSTDPSAAAPPEKFTLAFKFRPNQIVHQEITHEFQLTTNKNQDSETVRNYSKSRRHYHVTAVDDKTGVADMDMIIDWVHMLASFDKNDGSTSEPIEFQSDDPKKQPKKFDHILASIGKRAYVRFSPIGAPVKTAPGATAPLVTVAPGVTDGTLEAYFFPLPEKAVAVGEIWTEPFDVRVNDSEQNLVRVRLQRKFKLAQVKNGRAVIEFRTSIISPVKDPVIEAQFIERESAGKIEFDIEQGMIVSREWSIDKSIVNPVGANSSMRAKSRYREKLLGAEATADRQGKITPASAN